MKKFLLVLAFSVCASPVFAGTYYVCSGATGLNDGSSWANAYVGLSTATRGGKAPGSTYYVCSAHLEQIATTASAAMAFPGNESARDYVLVVSSNGSVPPAAADLTYGATYQSTGNIPITIAGSAYIYGLNILSGTGTSAAGSLSLFIVTAASSTLVFEDCVLGLGQTGSTAKIVLSHSGTENFEEASFINTSFSFGAVGQTILIDSFPIVWKNTTFPSLVSGSAIPTSLFTIGGNQRYGGEMNVTGVDLSPETGTLVNNTASGGTIYRILFQDCKFNASATYLVGTPLGHDSLVLRIVNSDSSNTTYNYYLSDFEGTVQDDTAITRSGGASDGSQNVSRKMTSNATGYFYLPLASDPILFYAAANSSVTVQVPLITDGVTLTSTDTWCEIEYLGNSSSPLGSYNVSTRGANLLSVGTALPTDSLSTWNGTGILTSPVKQILSATIYPQLSGLVSVRVMLARPNTTLRFDPKAISGKRTYTVGEVGYLNEAPVTGAGGSGR